MLRFWPKTPKAASPCTGWSGAVRRILLASLWPRPSDTVSFQARPGPFRPAKVTRKAPARASTLCSSKVAKALSPGARKRGRVRFAATGSREIKLLMPDPTAFAVQATATSRNWPLKSGRGRWIRAWPPASVSTTPDHNATVFTGAAASPAPPNSSPPKLTVPAAPRLGSSRRP